MDKGVEIIVVKYLQLKVGIPVKTGCPKFRTATQERHQTFLALVSVNIITAEIRVMKSTDLGVIQPILIYDGSPVMSVFRGLHVKVWIWVKKKARFLGRSCLLYYTLLLRVPQRLVCA